MEKDIAVKRLLKRSAFISVLCFVLCFSLLGADVYSASNSSIYYTYEHERKGYSYSREELMPYVRVCYRNPDNAYEFIPLRFDSNDKCSVPTNVTQFRIIVSSSAFRLFEGAKIWLSFQLRYGVGRLLPQTCWFGFPSSGGFATNTMASNEYSYQAGTSYPHYTCGSQITLNTDEPYLFIDFLLINRSSTDVFYPLGGVSFSVEQDIKIRHVVTEEEKNEQEYYKLWDDNKSFFENIANLPNFFVQQFNRMLDSIGGWFSSVGSNIASACSYLFNNVVNAVGGLGDKLGDWFANIGNSFKSALEDVFGSREEIKNELDWIDPDGNGIIDMEEYDNIQNQLDINAENNLMFPKLSDLLKENEELGSGVFESFFENPLIHRAFLCASVLAVLGFVLYGKR